MFSSTLLHAQSGPKWSVNGNAISPGDFIGSTNPYPFLVKTNNLDRFLIDPLGKVYVIDFKNLGVGFVTFDISGKLIPHSFSGNATDVLTGNGSFQNIAIVSGWKQIGFDLVNTNTANVGIGTSTPSEKLSVVGNILNDGFLLTRGISIIGRGQGERLNADTMQTNIMLMDTLSKIEGETRIVGNASVSEKFGIGTKYPTEALEIVGNSVINGNSRVYGNLTGNSLISDNLVLPSIQKGQFLTTDLSGKIVPMSQEQFQYLTLTPNLVKLCDTTRYQMAWVSSGAKIWADMPECAKVGIGTNNPLYTLDVVGNAHVEGRLKVGSSSIMIDPLGNENQLYTTAGSGDLLIQSYTGNNQNTIINKRNNGKVGIGTSVPQAKLDVFYDASLNNQYTARFISSASAANSQDSKGVYIETAGIDPGEALRVANVTNGNANLLLVAQGAPGSGSTSLGGVSIGDGYSGVASLEVNLSPSSTGSSNTLMRTGNKSMWFTNVLPTQGGVNNPIQQAGDQGIFWSDGGGNFGFNSTSGFVIAPYEPNHRGIRISHDGTIDAKDFLINGQSILAGGGASQWANMTTGISYIGNVGIGIANPTNQLEVCGTIRSKKVIVDVGWCDYVFEKDYLLFPLSKLEDYLILNKHLPGIKPAKEIEIEGVNLGDMLTSQMEKIEELTLYLIQQNKEIAELKKRLDVLSK